MNGDNFPFGFFRTQEALRLEFGEKELLSCAVWFGLNDLQEPDTTQQFFRLPIEFQKKDTMMIFLKTEDAIARMPITTSLQPERAALYKNDKQDKQTSFRIWNSEGNSSNDLMYPLTVREASRDDDNRWKRIAEAIAKDSNTEPVIERGNLNWRFLSPRFGGPYTVYFVPTDGRVTQEVLEKAFTALANARGRLTPLYLSAEGAQNPDLTKVGHNFIDLYDTYMTPAEYKNMVNQAQQERTRPSFTDMTGQNPWIRDFPGVGAETADSKLNNLHVEHSKPARTPLRQSTISNSNITAEVMEGVGARKDTQLKVMGEVSATWFTDSLWLTQHLGDCRVEWLHRCAHSFGNIDGPNQQAVTPQTFENLMFGTQDCNTDMMRAEYCVRNLLRKNRASTGSVETTVVFRDDNGNRLDGQRFLGTLYNDALPAVPDFIEANTGYSWLVPFLKYHFRVVDSTDKSFKHHHWVFDTFSRYRPLLFEILLDNHLIEVL